MNTFIFPLNIVGPWRFAISPSKYLNGKYWISHQLHTVLQARYTHTHTEMHSAQFWWHLVFNIHIISRWNTRLSPFPSHHTTSCLKSCLELWINEITRRQECGYTVNQVHAMLVMMWTNTSIVNRHLWGLKSQALLTMIAVENLSLVRDVLRSFFLILAMTTKRLLFTAWHWKDSTNKTE